MGGEPVVVPEPARLEFGGRWFSFDGFSNLDPFVAEEFRLPRGEWEVRRVEGEGTGLEVKEGFVEVWGDPRVYTATLIQLVIQGGYRAIPEVRVEERLRFEFRGFHLDVARGGVATVEELKRLLRWLFLLKYNYLAVYVEDLFPWDRYPDIGARRGRYTGKEWREVVEYGGRLGVEVFPSLELAGHMENILSLPGYRRFSEWHRPEEGCLDVGDPEARRFAEELLEEALEKTKSRYIHIGGDETWAMGRGRSLDRTLRFEWPRLYAEHHSRLLRLARERGKTPLIWGDMLAGMYLRETERDLWRPILENPAWREAVVANWDYSPGTVEYFKQKIRLFKERGYEQIVCPGLWNWDRYYPDFDAALANVKSFLQAAREEGVKGFMVTAWGDDGEECLYSFLYPLILASMEYAEGNGRWEEKWLALSGEPREVLEVRKALGKGEVANYVKRVLFSPTDEVKGLPVFDEWRKALELAERVRLPPDLEFVKRCLEVGLRKVEGKATAADLLGLASLYADLWLRERKPANLARVYARFYSAAALGRAPKARRRAKPASSPHKRV
ncbi:beta-N-acetylhexosaminidase [Thermofilum pendens]|uniref:beta-N-acetylhexosaminidase n=1 Tax=Thermofilum pendens (strain DSM 2475 / Hrk 5) TaxID=368408 RepID=A1RZR5_THEPD|nr:beta-N-acetylhexosaminidase [Thermofilum pendens]ABL78695.1 glycoside hydrolase, family 20 [Thermofilum pendens Hrk 5]